MANGGPIKQVNIDGRNFTVDSEAEVTFALGGYTNEIKQNGDGSMRLVKSLKPARANAISIVIDDERGDEEFIQKVIDKYELVNISITDVNEKVWSGKGQIVEDPETSKKQGTKEISVQGNFEMQK